MFPLLDDFPWLGGNFPWFLDYFFWFGSQFLLLVGDLFCVAGDFSWLSPDFILFVDDLKRLFLARCRLFGLTATFLARRRFTMARGRLFLDRRKLTLTHTRARIRARISRVDFFWIDHCKNS